ncbi:cytochrome P450 2K1-like isoform 1-T1 [Pholidichthys leucotaenia]
MGSFEDIFSSSSTLIGAFTLCLILVYGFLMILKPQNALNLPPGPFPLPVIGNLWHINLKRPHQSLCKLMNTYGHVFTVYLGTEKVVVLAGSRTIKEALIQFRDEFGQRYVSPILEDLNHQQGILFANGESWKELRQFALKTLRDFGMGKSVTQQKILEESDYLIQTLREFEGKPFNTARPLNHATSNIISSFVYGSRFEWNDPRFQSMVQRSSETISLAGSRPIQLYNMFPRLFGWVKNRKVMLANRDAQFRDMKDIIEGLKETLNPQEPRGFVDCFLIQMQQDQESGARHSHFHEKNLISSMTNLFSAGTDTTATTLRWALLLMAKYPHIQDQVYEELSMVIGIRNVSMDDLKHMPYTNAVIHETQRIANIVPMALPHQTSRDVVFQGYFIEKGTVVYPVLTSALYDENEWETPYTFNPSHFLKDGKFIKRDAFLPFSAGTRVCLGETLARMELFIFFVSLIQHFCFTPAPGVSEDELDLTPAVGFTLNPVPHELCALARQ